MFDIIQLLYILHLNSVLNLPISLLCAFHQTVKLVVKVWYAPFVTLAFMLIALILLNVLYVHRYWSDAKLVLIKTGVLLVKMDTINLQGDAIPALQIAKYVRGAWLGVLSALNVTRTLILLTLRRTQIRFLNAFYAKLRCQTA